MRDAPDRSVDPDADPSLYPAGHSRSHACCCRGPRALPVSSQTRLHLRSRPLSLVVLAGAPSSLALAVTHAEAFPPRASDGAIDTGIPCLATIFDEGRVTNARQVGRVIAKGVVQGGSHGGKAGKNHGEGGDAERGAGDQRAGVKRLRRKQSQAIPVRVVDVPPSVDSRGQGVDEKRDRRDEGEQVHVGIGLLAADVPTTSAEDLRGKPPTRCARTALANVSAVPIASCPFRHFCIIIGCKVAA